MKETIPTQNEKGKKNIKLITHILITILAIAFLAVLVFGEAIVSHFIVLFVFYIIVLVYAMYSSLQLANVFSSKYTVFALILIPRLILFVLLSIFVDHRMISLDGFISYIITRIAEKIGQKRAAIHDLRLAIDDRIIDLGEIEDVSTTINKEGE